MNQVKRKNKIELIILVSTIELKIERHDTIENKRLSHVLLFLEIIMYTTLAKFLKGMF